MSGRASDGRTDGLACKRRTSGGRTGRMGTREEQVDKRRAGRGGRMKERSGGAGKWTLVE